MIKDYIIDFLQKDLSPGSILDFVEFIRTEMTPRYSQLELPYLDEHSSFNWYIIDNSKIGKKKSKRFIDFASLDSILNEIEEHGHDVVIMCLTNYDYQLFSLKMKKRATLSNGFTAGWGRHELNIRGKQCIMYTYSRTNQFQF